MLSWGFDNTELQTWGFLQAYYLSFETIRYNTNIPTAISTMNFTTYSISFQVFNIKLRLYAPEVD